MIEIYKNFFFRRHKPSLIIMLVFMAAMTIKGVFGALGMDAIWAKVIGIVFAIFMWWIVMPCIIYVIDMDIKKSQQKAK